MKTFEFIHDGIVLKVEYSVYGNKVDQIESIKSNDNILELLETKIDLLQDLYNAAMEDLNLSNEQEKVERGEVVRNNIREIMESMYENPKP